MNQRERFEAWAKGEGGYCTIEAPYSSRFSGGYEYKNTAAAWSAWQEAARQMKERCAETAETIAAGRYAEDIQESIASAIRALGD